MRRHVFFSPAPFLPVAGADTKLRDPAVSQDFPAAAQHTGVRKFRTQIIVPQIGMCIKMDDMQIRIFLCQRLHRCQRHQVLAAQHKWYLAIPGNLHRPFPQIL